MNINNKTNFKYLSIKLLLIYVNNASLKNRGS